VNASEVATALRGRFDDVLVARGQVAVIVAQDDLVASLTWLRDEPGLAFDFLSSISVSDHPGAEPRFWMSYELRSMSELHRLRVKVGLAGDEPHVSSVTSLFPTADWHERECFDLFGIVCDGHPHLVRILLPDDWEGYPLRKDEDLGGVPTWYHGARIPPVDRRGMA
jgi:NADH-quinone oxidoreductase subunit C